MQTASFISKTFLNEHVVELKLKTEKLSSLPGQWVFIHFLDNQTPLKRAYSIAEAVNE